MDRDVIITKTGDRYEGVIALTPYGQYSSYVIMTDSGTYTISGKNLSQVKHLGAWIVR